MGIGYVPQGRDIFSHLTVEENLLLGLEATFPRIKQLPDSIFTMFPVLKEMLKRRGGDLSGRPAATAVYCACTCFETKAPAPR